MADYTTTTGISSYQGSALAPAVTQPGVVTLQGADVQIIGSLLPRPYIRSVILESSKTSNALQVEIELLIKDKLDDDMSLTWYGNKDFLKALKFLVYFCTDEDIGEILPDHMRRVITNGPSAAFKFLPAAQHVALQKNTKSLLIAGEFFKKAKNIVDAEHHYVDENGNIVYDISIRRTVTFDEPPPTYLSCKVMPYMDLTELADDIPMNMSAVSGQLVSDVILKHGKITAQTHIFVDAKGSAWQGAVQKIGDKYFIAQSAVPTAGVGTQLFLESFPNNKVQDFRHIQEIEKLKVDFEMIENAFLTNGALKLSTNDITKNVNYFSQMHISRSKSGNTNFFFGLDFQRLLEDNSRNGALYKRAGDKLVSDMIRSSRIYNLTVTRRRVQSTPSTNDLGAPGPPKAPFDKNAAPWVVVNSKDSQIGYSSGGPQQALTSEETDVGSIREIKVALENPSDKNVFRFFSGTDKTMTSVTDGLYQYSVEISIIDGSQKVLETILNALKGAAATYRKYYMQATTQNPVTKKMNFNIASRRFTQTFKAEKGPVTPQLQQAILIYATWLQLLTKASNAQTENLGLLWTISAPETGSPQGVSTVIKLMENLISRVSSVVGLPTKALEATSKAHAPLTTFTIKKDFYDTVDSNVPNDYGLDYLSLDDLFESNSTDAGINGFAAEDYFTRANKETLKYFTTTNVGITFGPKTGPLAVNDNVNNSILGYLAPAKVHIPSSDSIELINYDKPEVRDPEKYDLALSTALAMTHGKNSPYTLPWTSLPGTSVSDMTTLAPIVNLSIKASAEVKKAHYNFKEILKSMGVEVTLHKNLKELDMVLQDGDDTGTDSEDEAISAKSAGQSEVKTNSLAAAFLSPVFKGHKFKHLLADTQQKQEPPGQTINFFDPSNLKGFIKSVFLSTNATIPLPKIVESLPNQIKSLMIRDKQVVIKSWLSNKADLMRHPALQSTLCFDYLMLKKVEYLADFDFTGDGSSSLLAPVWKPLSTAVIDDLTGTIFCRLEDWKSDALGLKPPGFDIPVYDKYFTISLGVEAVASFLEDSLAIQQLTKDFQASSTTYNNPSYNSEFGMSF